MSDLQLERSVLEAKERDELFAIAQALGSKPSARTKKADLVSQILQVTGVEVEEATAPAEKPRRSRTGRAAATAERDTPADGPEQLELASTGSANGSTTSADANGTASANGTTSNSASSNGGG